MPLRKSLVAVSLAALASVVGCVDDNDDDNNNTIEPIAADYGDAPDGRLLADGSFDSDGYPTLFGANGARVLDTAAVALADVPSNGAISLELDADDPTDPDGEPNFSKFRQPQPDAENRDDHDNGVIATELDLSNPGDPQLNVRVGALLKDQARAGVYYLNVLFDNNLDGAWNGDAAFAADDPVQVDTSADLNDEWIVKNMEVSLDDVTAVKELNFDLPLAGAIYSTTRVNGTQPYMRLALTRAPISTTTWKGEGEFAVGEIEDWLIAGLDDPPKLDCGQPPVPLFDFAGNAQLALPCGVVRPQFSNDATAINFQYQFRPLVAPADVLFNLTKPNPLPASAGQATIAAPLGLGVNAALQGNIKGIVRRFAVDIATDLDGATFIKRGTDSSITVELSETTEYIEFTDTAEETPELTACIGVTGSHNTPYGGQILQLTHDKGDCAMIPNDGMTDGTFIVSGGEGFRDRGEMFLSILGGNSAFMGSGNIVSATYDGVPLSATLGWEVPVDQSSTGILDVTFSSGLSFEIRIDITFNATGFNTVTQTIISGRCELL